MTKQAYSVDEFCEGHGFCRATLYNLWRAGKGPRSMLVGKRRIISAEAAAEWRRAMEDEADRTEAA